jgi:UDP-galactopyranose mutase
VSNDRWNHKLTSAKKNHVKTVERARKTKVMIEETNSFLEQHQTPYYKEARTRIDRKLSNYKVILERRKKKLIIGGR